MLLSDIRDWIKTFNIADHYYIGRLDAKKERSIGVYSRNRSSAPVMALGGLDNSSYDIKSVSILVHWNQNARETETAARNLWDHLQQISNLDIGEDHIDYLMLLVPEPISVGADDDGIYEYVIEFDLYYRRK